MIEGFRKVHPLKVENLVNEILLPLDSNVGPLNNKANALSTDPAQ